MPTPEHEIAIIGAGLSGIGCAIALRAAGFDDIVIYERAGDIGGTWRDNTYPGIGVDVPAQAYQFSYELKPDWSRLFATGREVKAYVDQVCDRYGIRPLIRFDSEVRARTWDAHAHVWRLAIGAREVTARWVISAIGPFVERKPCDIPGVDEFAGTIVHSAAWDHTVSLRGKRVAIVGTGASAVQIIPEIAREVAHLDVYQRTPIWVAPKLDVVIPRPVQALFRRAPRIQDKVRRWFTRSTERVLLGAVLDRQGSREREARLRWWLEHVWYPSQIRDRELRAKLIPDYLFGCKRPAVSNTYLRTFTRPNVELVTEPIERITPRGLRTVAGRERAVEILILATGFRIASDPEIFRRTPVRGRDGFDLATFYDEQRAASYESISMPQLPNHFMIFGPYGWTGGTWHELVETASAHIVRVLAEARARGATSVEVRAEAAERWTAFARERIAGSHLHGGGCATANSYYFDKHGDTPFLRPTSARDAWRAARTFPLDDYVFTAHAAALAKVS